MDDEIENIQIEEDNQNPIRQNQTHDGVKKSHNFISDEKQSDDEIDMEFEDISDMELSEENDSDLGEDNDD